MGVDYRWLLGSTWLSNLGDGVALAAGPLLVASLTRDPLLVGAATLLQFLPALLLGLYAGVVVDRSDRRRVAVLVDGLRAVLITVLVATIVLDVVTIWLLLVVLFLVGTTEIFADTAFGALLPQVVGPRDLGVANARQMGGFIVANRLAGPPLGAAMFAAGAAWPFVTQVVCAALAVLLATRIRLRRPPVLVDRTRGAVGREIREGLLWLRGHPAMRTLTLTIVSFNVTFGAAFAVLVLYALDRLQMGALGFGLLTTASAAGGVLGMLVFGRLEARVPLGWLMRAGLLVETGFHLVFAVNRLPVVALAAMVVLGLHEFVWGTIGTSVRQRAVPEVLQGRVGAAYRIASTGGIVVGAGLGSVLARLGGLTAPFWFAFVGSAVLVVLLWRSLMAIAHEDEALRDA